MGRSPLCEDFTSCMEIIKGGGNPEYDGWFEQPLNNALLKTLDTYYALVPAFRSLLAQQGGVGTVVVLLRAG